MTKHQASGGSGTHIAVLRAINVGGTKKITMTIVEPEQIIDHVIDREGKVESETVHKDHPVFDRWALGHMMAGMDLKEGLKFKMKGLFPGSKAVKKYTLYVGARTTFKDAHGEDRDVWPVMHPMGGTTLGTYFVDTRPPYLIGFEMMDIKSQEIGMRVTLAEFQSL